MENMFQTTNQINITHKNDSWVARQVYSSETRRTHSDLNEMAPNIGTAKAISCLCTL